MKECHNDEPLRCWDLQLMTLCSFKELRWQLPFSFLMNHLCWNWSSLTDLKEFRDGVSPTSIVTAGYESRYQTGFHNSCVTANYHYGGWDFLLIFQTMTWKMQGAEYCWGSGIHHQRASVVCCLVRILLMEWTMVECCLLQRCFHLIDEQPFYLHLTHLASSCR